MPPSKLREKRMQASGIDYLEARKASMLSDGRTYFSGLFCLSSGITDLLLFGIASRP
jgi:hypothetical protein